MPLGYKPKWFSLEELVPKRVFEDRGKAVLQLFDPRILTAADALRERYGKMIVNNWPFGGKNEYCGWRPAICNVGTQFSQHRFGRALDLHPQDTELEEIIHDLRVRPDRRAYQFITAVEDDVSWLHIDCRNNTKGGILFFKP